MQRIKYPSSLLKLCPDAGRDCKEERRKDEIGPPCNSLRGTLIRGLRENDELRHLIPNQSTLAWQLVASRRNSLCKAIEKEVF